MHLEQVMGWWQSFSRRCMKDVTIYKGTHVETSGYLDYNGRIKNLFRIPVTKIENNVFLLKFLSQCFHSLFIKYIHAYIAYVHTYIAYVHTSDPSIHTYIYLHTYIHTYTNTCIYTYIYKHTYTHSVSALNIFLRCHPGKW